MTKDLRIRKFNGGGGALKIFAYLSINDRYENKNLCIITSDHSRN